MQPLKIHYRSFFQFLVTAFCLPGFCVQVLTAGGTAAAHPHSGHLLEEMIGKSPTKWSFEFRDEPLDRALFLISERTGAEFIYEPRLTAGITVRAVFREEELRDILDAVLLPSGLEARRIRTGIYVIRHTLRREISAPARVVPEPDGQRLAPLAPKRVPAAATDQALPVSEIIRKIVVP